MANIPPAQTDVQHSPEMAEAKAVMEQAEEAGAQGINFPDGTSISPLQFSGLDEYRIRVATDGWLSSSEEIWSEIAKMSLQATAALWYVAKLNADGLKPGQADYSWESLMEEVSMETLMAAAEAIQNAGVVDDPT